MHCRLSSPVKTLAALEYEGAMRRIFSFGSGSPTNIAYSKASGNNSFFFLLLDLAITFFFLMKEVGVTLRK